MSLDVFATGLSMGESPRWHDGRLWVCDWLAGEVIAYTDDGKPEVQARIEGLPFSIDWLPDGRLVATTPAGLVVGTDLVPLGENRRAWNEIVVAADGTVYVDMPGSMPGEHPLPGVLGVVTPDGRSRIAAGSLWFPNGMALTPDGTTLLVAESHAHRITAFDIADDGTVGKRRVWADLDEAAAPDGVCLDAEGALWYADVPNQHVRRVTEGGKVLDTVEVGQACFACMLGGADGRTLFVVANDWGPDGASNGRILTTQAPAPHAGRP